MNHTETFFLAIGYWNLVGSLVLYAMLSPKIADIMLRTWCQIIAFPYDVGKYGSMWLWWAATTNLFYSYVNIMAAKWDDSAQFHVLLGNIIFYGVFFLLTIGAARNKDYASGNFFNIGLCGFWLGWAIYLFQAASFY